MSAASNSKTKRSEAGHRKLVRLAILIAFFMLVVAAGALLMRLIGS
jgi:hypothetical protein